jgi:hypothetical protein
VQLALVVVLLLLVACASTTDESGTEPQLFPDVVAVEVQLQADGTYSVTATLSSPYDTSARYADAWRVLAPEGTVLGIRELAHDHAGEQPFTRSLGGVAIPDGTSEVEVEGRDQISGWGGGTFTAPVPQADN